MSAFIQDLIENPITQITVAISVVFLIAAAFYSLSRPKMALLAAKNLRRNMLRTILTCLATMALVFMITMIWSVIYMLDAQTREKAADFKLIVTERWQIPSQMPMGHADYLNPEKSQYILPKEFNIRPDDFMVWSFYGGTTEKGKMSPETIAFFFALNPNSIIPMMEELSDIDPALPKKLIDNPRGCLLGRDRMRNLNKVVGERFTIYSLNFKDVDLEFEIVGALPDGRYDKLGIFNIDYLNNSLDKWSADRGGKKHPLDERRLNLIWLRVKDRETFEKAGAVIESSPYFASRPVRCDMASAAVGNFLESYGDMLRFVKWVMVPAILFSMALVVANAISITVRERRSEMAVLKVLGYSPNSILMLVWGESLLVGAISGFLAGLGAVFIVNVLIGGVPLPIAWFPAFFVPGQAAFWGLAMGIGTAFLGSFLPAWQARSVKVSEVFAKVA